MAMSYKWESVGRKSGTRVDICRPWKMVVIEEMDAGVHRLASTQWHPPNKTTHRRRVALAPTRVRVHGGNEM